MSRVALLLALLLPVAVQATAPDGWVEARAVECEAESGDGGEAEAVPGVAGPPAARARRPRLPLPGQPHAGAVTSDLVTAPRAPPGAPEIP